MVSRSPLVRDPAFFQPGHLGGQASNLGIQVLHLLVVGGLSGFSRVAPVEGGGEGFESNGFPITKQGGMDLVLGGELGDDLFSFKSSRITWALKAEL